MKLYEDIKGIISEQYNSNYTDDARIEAITHMMVSEIQCVATQYARHQMKIGETADFSTGLKDFIENHYNR